MSDIAMSRELHKETLKTVRLMLLVDPSSSVVQTTIMFIEEQLRKSEVVEAE